MKRLFHLHQALRCTKIRAERALVQRQIEQLQAKMQRMSSLSTGAECPTCSQPLGESFEMATAHITAEQAKLSERLSELAVVETAKAAPPESVTESQIQVQNIQRAVERPQTKLQELQKCQQLEAKVKSLESEQSSYTVEIRSAEENLGRAKEKLAGFKFTDEEYLKEKGRHDAAQRLLEVARLQRVRLEGELNTQRALVARTQDEIARFEERCSELEKLRREVRIVDECDRIVTAFRKFVNSSIRPRMAELASEYLTDLTDGRYSTVELEEDFTPTVLEDGEPKRIISGGEEDILNLCMRISLSHMLAERAGQNFSLLMLDEVFGSLDENRR